MAQRLAVEGQVSGEDERVGLLSGYLVCESAHELVYVQHNLAVGVVYKLGEVLALVGELRGEVVQIRGHSYGHSARRVPGDACILATCQRKRPDYHSGRQR